MDSLGPGRIEKGKQITGPHVVQIFTPDSEHCLLRRVMAELLPSYPWRRMKFTMRIEFMPFDGHGKMAGDQRLTRAQSPSRDKDLR